jgi:hypothetical protein
LISVKSGPIRAKQGKWGPSGPNCTNFGQTWLFGAYWDQPGPNKVRYKNLGTIKVNQGNGGPSPLLRANQGQSGSKEANQSLWGPIRANQGQMGTVQANQDQLRLRGGQSVPIRGQSRAIQSISANWEQLWPNQAVD